MRMKIASVGTLLWTYTTISLSFMACAFAQTAETPVLVANNSSANAMMIIDDSNSMVSVVEHANFDASSAIANDANNTIPDVIFRLESGSNAPNPSRTLRPVLIEYNYLFNNVLTAYRGQVTGNLFESTSFNQVSNMDLLRTMGCTTSGAYCCPPIGSCDITKVYGINHAKLYSNSSVIGSNVFQTSNLAQQGGNYITDSNGHEYLYMNYSSNIFYQQAFNWGSYWPRFDSQGNALSYQTRVYVTTGGTVVFNGKEVFLGAGLYRIEYLRWIFYQASAAELAALPGLTRLQLVKDVMEMLILNNPTVNFGLTTLNGSNLNAGVNSGYIIDQFYTPEGNTSSGQQPKVRAEIGTSPSDLINSLDAIGGIGGTPLANTYIETMRYYDGDTDNDPYCSSCTYTSPIDSECQSNFIVLLTDGLPTGESANNFRGSSIQDTDSDGEDGASSNSNCSSSVCANFLDDASKLAYDTDFSDLSGTQNIISYAVGLGLDFDLLDDFAANGGSQQSLRADTADEITQALEDIVAMIINTPVSGAGVALAENYGENGMVYRPRFQADTWNGNLDVYEFDSNGALTWLFDMGTKLEDRDLDDDPRTIITGYDPDFDGYTNTSLEFTAANASTLRPELFRFFDNGTENSSLLASPISDHTDNDSASTLINFIHGLHFTGMRVRDRDQDGNVEKLGDIVYSQPIFVDEQNGSYNSMLGYSSYVRSRKSQKDLVLVGANDGMLHAFDANSGEELWAYIPSSQLPYLERLSREFYNRLYRRSYVDGQINVQDVYIGGSWKTYAMFGLRKGGSSYVVLDITEREEPVLVYEVSPTAEAGESWSHPAVVVTGAGSGSSSPDQFDWRMVVGTGEGKQTPGVNVLAFPLNSSTAPSPTVIQITSNSIAGTRTSSLTPGQTDRDLNVDRIYLGTEEGDIYRVELAGNVSGWNSEKLFDGNSSNPITAAPTLVLVDNPVYDPNETDSPTSIDLAVGVFVGTGRYDEKVDINSIGGNTQRIYAIFDPVNIANDQFTHTYTNVTTSTLKNQSISSFDVVQDSDDGIYRIPPEKKGFYMNLDTSINLSNNEFINPVGMITHPAVNVRGAVVFSTFLPNQDQCSVGGHGFVQALNFRTGGGMVVDHFLNPQDPFYNGGIHDFNESSAISESDISSGISQDKIEPVVDVQVTSINLSDKKPYKHDGQLTAADIRLHSSNGGIEAAVSSLGNTGAPGPISVSYAEGVLLLQPTLIDLVDDGSTDSDDDSDQTDSGDQDTPPPGDDGEQDGNKITICHIPPGNPAAAHTITVSINAWPAHQAHGDYQGSCNIPPEDDEEESEEGEEEQEQEEGTSSPETLPFNIYNSPVEVLSFHESTG